MARRRTKIIVTVGPSSWDPDVLERLIRAGADAFRINFAHGDPKLWHRLVEVIRKVDRSATRPLIGDLQGPVVRLGKSPDIPVSKGDRVTLKLTEKGDASSRVVPLPAPIVFEHVRLGDIVLIESGRVSLRVDDVREDAIVCTALIDGVIKGGKTFAIKGRDLPLPSLTDKDIEAVKFSMAAGLDYISLSFVRTKQDVEKLKQLLTDLGAGDIRIIAKVETRSAVENLNDIVGQVDAVLVARGDLAIYFDLEEVPVIQREIIRKARRAGRPAIIATQLLDSMVNSPLPTRSEVVDVYTAVKDCADALLLTNETAVGKYPVESVEWLSRILERAEKGAQQGFDAEPTTLYEAVAKAAVMIADLLGAKIVAYSETGNTARRIATYRPRNEVHVFTSNPRTCRQVNILWGIKPHYCSLTKQDPMLFEKLLTLAREEGIVSYGDIVVLTAGARKGATDIVRVERVTG